MSGDGLAETLKERVAAATVRFPRRNGQGVLVPGGLVITAAHVIEWRHEGMFAEEAEFVQQIEIGPAHDTLLVYPLAVELVADLAILGALDSQWHPDAAKVFEEFYRITPTVPLDTREYSLQVPIPAWVFTHEGRWVEAAETNFASGRTSGSNRASRFWAGPPAVRS